MLFGSQIFGWIGDRYGRKTALILAQPAVRRASPTGPPIRPTSPSCSGCASSPGSASAASSRTSWRSTPNRRRAICAPRSPSSPSAWCRSAARSPASPPRRSCRTTAGRSCSTSAASCRSYLRSPRSYGLPESIKFMTLHESHRGKMEALIAAIRPDFKVPPNARFVIEDEKQLPSSNPRLSVPQRAGRDHAADLADVRLNLMGYFFLISWTPTLMAAAQVPPQTGGARRRGVAGRRHGRRAAAVLVAAAAALPRHRHPVRDRGAGGRRDRLCRVDARPARW